MKRLIALSFSFLILASCTKSTEAAPKSVQPSPLDKFVLAADPGAAQSIVAAKKKGPQDGIIITGRVHDITKGFAMMKLMDASMDYCGQVDKTDRCSTPWDYCCDSKEDRIANSLLVELRGPNGKPMTASSIPQTRHCDLLKAKGNLIKDPHGNLVFVADGIWRAERPTLADNVKWPK